MSAIGQPQLFASWLIHIKSVFALFHDTMNPLSPAAERKNSALRENLRCYIDWNQHEITSLDALVSQLWANGEETVFDRKNMTGHITASMLVLSPDNKYVLVIHHRVLDRLLPPGGHIDTVPQIDSDLRANALREVEEETGVCDIEPILLDDEFDIPLDIDTHDIPARPEKDEGPHVHHDFLFLGRATAQTEPVPQANEVSAATWRPLTEFLRLPLSPRLVRVQAKLQELGIC